MDGRPLYTAVFTAGEQRAQRLCGTWRNWYQGKRWLAYSVLRLDAVFKVELEYSLSGATILNSRFTKLNKYFTGTLMPTKRRGRRGLFRKSALKVQSTLAKTLRVARIQNGILFWPGKHHIITSNVDTNRPQHQVYSDNQLRKRQSLQ